MNCVLEKEHLIEQMLLGVSLGRTGSPFSPPAVIDTTI